MVGIVKGLYLERISYFLKSEKADISSRSTVILNVLGKEPQNLKTDCATRAFLFIARGLHKATKPKSSLETNLNFAFPRESGNSDPVSRNYVY